VCNGHPPFDWSSFRYNREFWQLLMGKDYTGVGYLTGRRLSLTRPLYGTPCEWMMILKFHMETGKVSTS
jgi:hypothetical protein